MENNHLIDNDCKGVTILKWVSVTGCCDQQKIVKYAPFTSN